MPSINEEYKFQLNLPDVGWTVVYPEIDELTWKWEFRKDQKFYTLEIETELVFSDNEHKTFAAIKDIEDKGVCLAVPLLVQYKNNVGTYVDCYEGFIPFRKGTWSFSEMSLTVNARSNTPMKCVLDNWKVKRNLLEVSERVTISTIIGEVECVTVNSYNNYPSAPPGHGWLATEIKETVEYEDSPYTNEPNGREWTVKFCREVNDVTGDGWVEEGGLYYRKLSLGSKTETTIEESGGGGSVELIFVITNTVYNIINVQIQNGLTLKSALEYLFSFCSLSVSSNFLNINPIVEDIDLSEYDYAAEDFGNVAIFHAFDIIRPDANVATLLNKSLDQLLGDLINKLSLYVFYDVTNATVRIEHESYRSRRLMLNLLQSQYSFDIKGLRTYEYNDSDFPRLEIFNDFYSSDSLDFKDCNIEFEADCSTEDSQTQEKKVTLQNVICDVTSVYQNKDLEEDSEIRTAIVMVALNPNGTMISRTAINSGDYVLNAPFAYGNILPRYFLRDRPLLNGKINGVETQFISTKTIRKQKDITISMSKTDFFTNFNPSDKVKSQFGWGEPEGVEYDGLINELSFDIGFRIKP